MTELHSARTDARFNAAGVYASYVRSLDGTLREVDLIVDGIHCAGCVHNIESGLREAGVAEASVNLATHRATVCWDDARLKLGDLLAAMRRLGYPAQPYDPGTQEAHHRRQIRTMLMRLGLAGFGSGNVMIYAVALWAGAAYGIEPELHALFQWISLAICVPVLLISGWPFLHGALSGLRNWRFNMDSLISLGLLTTFGYSLAILAAGQGGETYFESVVMVIFFLLIGRFLETLARGRSGSITERLMGLQGKWAIRLAEGGEEVVSVDEVQPGDRLIVRTGEAVPADGVVRSGSSELDESALTGESRLRVVDVGDGVTAGTINRGGALEMEARQVGAETALARICRLVEQAQTHKPRVQKMADWIAGRFVWAVLALSGGTFAYWNWIAAEQATQPAWITAISVLIVACPCALGLATPLAVIAGSARAARDGVLVKGGDVLERAARVTDIVLDKTGTLTTGGFAVRGVVSFANAAERDWIRLAVALERRALHPIAHSLQIYATERWPNDVIPLAGADHVQVAAGRGIMGEVDGQAVVVGNRLMLAERGIAIPEDGQGAERSALCTEVFVAIGGILAGRIELVDPLRPNALAVARALQASGYRVHLFSGDRPDVVHNMAEQLGIESARGGMMPSDKLVALEQLQRAGRIVAMVGDGINDAPALMQADLGIAMSTGSDIALDAAHVILMTPRLEGTLATLEVARRTRRTILGNLGLSVGYNALAVPAAMLGWMTPLLAAIAMSCSSLLVVGGALRLRWTGDLPGFNAMPGVTGPIAPIAARQPGLSSISR